jgi:hypothetical protein
MTKLNDLKMSTMDILMAMSEGNPGALRVCAELVKAEHIMTLLMLDTIGVYGSRIWMLYKDVCGEDLQVMCRVLDTWRKGDITKAQLMHAIENYGEGLPGALVTA